LIERLWRLVKSEVLNARCIDTFKQFQKVIDKFPAEAHPTHLGRMTSLIIENIQQFDNMTLIMAT
jgi:hypothetical protein